jgi:hypothetical protein
MYILVAADGELSLQDSDNMRAFSIREAAAGSAARWLAQMASPAAEVQHYWIDANAVLEISGRRDDAQWVKQFWDMLTKVEAYGYSDMTKKRVKAHLDQV